ncbi:MAG TPA: CHAT domain-containing tetratricopeptide repeat protein [Ktedonobacteraceae bacterium]|nr:CHAT domain-containing tetratricopeptide repeat protein [Ktedonobacteraceae bacterium]
MALSTVENDLFLQQLCTLSLEEGRAYIREHASQITDYDAIAELIRGESLRQRYINAFISLKLAELLAYFGDYFQHEPSYALGLVAKGDALFLLGQYQAAAECLDTAGAIFLKRGDEVSWAHTRVGWIIAGAWVGRVTEALQGAARAHEIFERHGQYFWMCSVDHNLAVVYKRLGRYQDALALYDRVLALYPTISGPDETNLTLSRLGSQGNKGINLSLLGQFEEASHLLQETQHGYRALQQWGGVAKIDLHLAEIDYVQGYYGSALDRYYHAWDTLRHNHVDNEMLLAELKLRMSECLMKFSRVKEASRLASEAVTIYRQHGVSLDTGEALCQYARTLIDGGRAEEALAALNEAWTLFHQGGFEHYASDTILHRAELLVETGPAAEAYTQAYAANQFFEAKGLISHTVRARLVMVSALLKSVQQSAGDQSTQANLLQKAEVLCKQTLVQARQRNLQEQVYKCHHLLGQLAAFQGKMSQAAWRYRAAIAQIERMLDDLAYDLSPSFLRTAGTVYEDMIALCLQQSQTERAFSYLERARSTALRQYLHQARATHGKEALPSMQARSAALLQLHDELSFWQGEYRRYSSQLATLAPSASALVDRDTLERDLKRCEAKLNELFERVHLPASTSAAIHLPSKGKQPETPKRKRIDGMQVRHHLAPDQLLLAYFLYQQRLILFALTREGLSVHEHADGVAQLEHLFLLLHAHLQTDGWPDPQQPQPQQQQVARRLLRKLYDLLIAPVAALLPASSGSLTIVPYGPLHKLPFHALYDGSQFLIERFQINYLPASNLLLHLHTLAGRTTTSTRPPLVFGYSQQGQLQRTLDEAQAVTELVGAQCYLEQEATIARWIEQAPGSRLIHLATHGHSRMDAPNFSSIRLADGQLTALDVFDLNLAGCELVTLSGCETGLALSSGGDEQIGLERAFLAASVPSLVTSLWPVEDNATNELMKSFYEHLLRGESKVQALRAAQCRLLHGTSPAYTHPYFWAAFRLVGDIGPLHQYTPKVNL